jgi:hypothetical protein
MHSVDDRLRPEEASGALNDLSRHSFICHRCEKTFAARSDELYYFPDRDMVYHRHGSDFYRALMIKEDGTIMIGAFDSEEENVLQLYKLVLDGEQAVGASSERPELLIDSSRKFFESMRAQRRRLVSADFSVRMM